MTYVGRLAPSPTGALHLGNARTFLAAWLRARQAGGRLILRMEDIDGPRVKASAAADALADLRRLGLTWDEGPDVGGPHAPYTQSERLPRYEAVLRDLVARGLAYPCVCTRSEVQEAASAPHGPDGPVYPGTCRGRFVDGAAAQRETGRVPAYRFAGDPHGSPISCDDRFAGACRFPPELARDFVIAKKDGEPAYQLAVVVDDAAMGVTEVVRADDLLPSTPKQLALYAALGHAPPAFCHVPLVVGEDGRRLAKRHGDTRLSAFFAAGAPPERLVALLAGWLGVAVRGGEARPEELVPHFDLARIPRGPLVYRPREVAAALGLARPPA